ncbi:553_t:CDS:2 [Entrophospora sp. SA101]|nr:553_t:CDS:2 [Entrophospora sp. SA101]
MLKIFKKENEKNNENLLNSSSRTYNCSPTHSQRTSTSIINNSTTTSNNDKIHTTSSTREMIVTSGQLLLSTIEDSFSNYLPAIQKITALCEKIIKSYETVKENKKICRVLIDRVELTHIAVKQLVRTRQENEEKFRDPEYFKAFDRLQKTLENIETFIKKISNYGAFRKFDNADSVKKCFEDYINDLEQVSKDLGFNITLRIYHDLNDLKENNEKYSKMWENFNKSFKNVGKSEIDQVVLIGKIKKSLKSNDFESKEELFKIPEIDTKDIEDVKPQYKKATDIRGKDSNVVKKVLRKTIDVACKYIVGDLKDDNDSVTKKYSGQLIILNAIQCEYIVKFYGISNVDSRKALIFGWAEKGNLKDLYETHYIDWITKLKITHDIIKGLIFIHRCKYLHRNVRCENVLIDENGNPKISNFDLNRALFQLSKRTEKIEDYLPWLAPEKILVDHAKPNLQPYDFPCEMFSFGMLLWELTYQQVPYKGKGSEKIKDHVLSAWEVLPHDRPTFDEVMDILTGLWKPYESCNYSAKFLAKNEISADKLHVYNIEMPTDFEKDNTLYVEEYKKYLHLAAKNENVIALFKLGQYYLSGFQGRDQNADLARQYLQSAVLQNYNEEVSRRAIELINNMEKNDTEKTVESKKI